MGNCSIRTQRLVQQTHAGARAARRRRFSALRWPAAEGTQVLSRRFPPSQGRIHVMLPQLRACCRAVARARKQGPIQMPGKVQRPRGSQRPVHSADECQDAIFADLQVLQLGFALHLSFAAWQMPAIYSHCVSPILYAGCAGMSWASTTTALHQSAPTSSLAPACKHPATLTGWWQRRTSRLSTVCRWVLAKHNLYLHVCASLHGSSRGRCGSR